MNTTRSLLLLSLALPLAAAAQTTVLAPQQERISDAVIQQDHGAYERLQARIKGLNDGGRRVADYHLAKAQCWLDVSFHEYTRNDRSAFPQAALSESEKLIVAMETKVAPLPRETPLVNDAARLRPDLWERLRGLQSSAGFVCAAQKAACGEVELVHAGNEFNQQQWRHAKPYVQIAEDLVAEAEAAATRCVPATPVALAAAPPAAAPPSVAVAKGTPVELGASVVFAFDRSGRADIRPAARAQLDALLARVARDRLRVVSVRLVGHADRLNGTGDGAYNQRLSERRALTVRSLLVERGIDAAVIEVGAVGAAGPVERCEAKTASLAALEDCLQPNRRVEVVLSAVGQP